MFSNRRIKILSNLGELEAWLDPLMVYSGYNVQDQIRPT